jgi:predicted ArsR family transcriptional regulator
MADLVTVAEAATRMRCHPRQVFRLLRRGVLTRGPKYGRRTVVTLESLEAALAAPAELDAPVRRKRVRQAMTKAEFNASIEAL